MNTAKYASAEECRPLYELMIRVRDLAPWYWMSEDDLFAIENPETGNLGYISIMGEAGEHFAVAVYLGTEGLRGFKDMQEAGPFITIENAVYTPQLQASLEDREFLDKYDREQIKHLGLKFRGRNEWPLFRSYRPGFVPWYLEPLEAVFLRHALEQVLEVAPRVRENRAILKPGGKDDYLVRVALKDKADLIWRDAVRKPDPLPPLEIKIEIEPSLTETIKQLPKRRSKVEADFFMLPTPVEGEGDRPFFPNALLMVDGEQGQVLGMELLNPIPTSEVMWGRLGASVLRLMAQNGWVPSELHIQDELFYDIMRSIGRVVGFKVKRVKRMPFLNFLAEGLIDQLSGGLLF